ncbi:MAG TPA: hypothetical protein VHW96_06475 [Solirubrobacteraceae bacterium]|nr:hypothetical protein [Solirubrobacteraceae bacterium]
MVRGGARRAAIVVPGVAGLLTAAVMSATAATAPAPSTLSANGVLTYPNYLQSPDGHFHVVMESNGNLAETIPGDRTLWSTGTSQYPGARAVMQVNGNLVVYDPTNTAVWSSNSPTVGCPRLVLQNDGNLVIYGNTASSWSAQSGLNKMLKGDVLKSGWSLYSKAPEAYRLTMLADGNLALFDGSGTELWSTKTYGHAGAYASMQTDGNLVVYDKTGHALWSSATNGHPGSHLDMLGDGNVDIIDPGGTVVWRSQTYHKGSGVSLAPRAPAAVTCPAPQPPAPPVTTTTTTTAPVVTVPVPVPAPKPRTRQLRIRLEISWTFKRATTRVHGVKVGTFPGRTKLQVQCKGRGCPRHRGKDIAKGIRHVHQLLHALVGRRYQAGNKLIVTLQAPGYHQERAELDIRFNAKPHVKLLR